MVLTYLVYNNNKDEVTLSHEQLDYSMFEKKYWNSSIKKWRINRYL